MENDSEATNYTVYDLVRWARGVNFELSETIIVHSISFDWISSRK